MKKEGRLCECCFSFVSFPGSLSARFHGERSAGLLVDLLVILHPLNWQRKYMAIIISCSECLHHMAKMKFPAFRQMRDKKQYSNVICKVRLRISFSSSFSSQGKVAYREPYQSVLNGYAYRLHRLGVTRMRLQSANCNGGSIKAQVRSTE